MEQLSLFNSDYWVLLSSGHHDGHADVVPHRILPLLSVSFADRFGLCKDCPLSCRPHPIATNDGTKYCTVLFHDAVKPDWSIEDLNP